MIGTVRVNVVSGDRPRRVDVVGDGALARPCAPAGNVERGDGAVRGAQETVIHIARVDVESLSRSCIVDASGIRALVGTCAHARNIEHGDGAVGSAQVAVIDIVRVNRESRDCPRRIETIYATHIGSLERASARARGIEAGDRAAGSSHDPVSH